MTRNMYIRYQIYTILYYIRMLVRLWSAQIQEQVPYGHTTEGGVDCFDVLLPERFLNMTDSDGRYVGPLTTVTDSHVFDVQVLDSWECKQGHTVKHKIHNQTIPAGEEDGSFDMTDVHSYWAVPKTEGYPLKMHLRRHALPPYPLEEEHHTFYRDNKIVAKLTLRIAVEDERDTAKEQLDAKLRQEVERSWNAAKEEQETLRARNAANEQQEAEFKERLGVFVKQFQESVRARKAAEEEQKTLRARKAAKEEQEQKAREKAREQPRPAPSGESAEKSQRCLHARNRVDTRKRMAQELEDTRKRMAQELEDLRSGIRRVSKLTEKEAKTFKHQQMRIWHPDKRAGMDKTQEEKDHAAHMFHVLHGHFLPMQKMAMDE